MPQFQSLSNVVISSYNRPPAAIRLEKDQMAWLRINMQVAC